MTLDSCSNSFEMLYMIALGSSFLIFVYAWFIVGSNEENLTDGEKLVGPLYTLFNKDKLTERGRKWHLPMQITFFGFFLGLFVGFQLSICS